jgi:hypothetical protein
VPLRIAHGQHAQGGTHGDRLATSTSGCTSTTWAHARRAHEKFRRSVACVGSLVCLWAQELCV